MTKTGALAAPCVLKSVPPMRFSAATSACTQLSSRTARDASCAFRFARSIASSFTTCPAAPPAGAHGPVLKQRWQLRVTNCIANGWVLQLPKPVLIRDPLLFPMLCPRERKQLLRRPIKRARRLKPPCNVHAPTDRPIEDLLEADSAATARAMRWPAYQRRESLSLFNAFAPGHSCADPSAFSAVSRVFNAACKSVASGSTYSSPVTTSPRA